MTRPLLELVLALLLTGVICFAPHILRALRSCLRRRPKEAARRPKSPLAARDTISVLYCLCEECSINRSFPWRNREIDPREA
jgi:hypothetical protein